MKKRLFPLLIALSALSVAGSAAFYSVFGLSKLFAGAATQVIIMAASLEFAKLVVASLLYQYWDSINKILRGYLMIACFVLMVITSGGIYGFLSGAYQSTATQSELLDKSLVILNQKQIRFEETKEDLTLEKTQINKSISDLRVSLSNPHSVSWYDKNSETVITSSSGSARRALQAELKTTIADRDNINLKLEAILDSITSTDITLLNKEISNEGEQELGPLKYLAKTTGWSMDKVVNYFLLLIVFVFDPLAIALVVAANFAFARIRKPKEITMPPLPEVESNNSPQISPGPSEELKQRVKENQEKLKEKEIDEEEMDKEYFDELKQYIEFTKEHTIDNLTYPQFVEKHYPKPEAQINTYGDDEWATPAKEEEITVDGGEIEVTVEPSPEQLKNLEETREEKIAQSPQPINPTKKDLERLEKFLKLEKKSEQKETSVDRLTDTTQTLIIKKKGEEIKDDINYSDRDNQILDVNGHHILRYRKYR